MGLNSEFFILCNWHVTRFLKVDLFCKKCIHIQQVFITFYTPHSQRSSAKVNRRHYIHTKTLTFITKRHVSLKNVEVDFWYTSENFCLTAQNQNLSYLNLFSQFQARKTRKKVWNYEMKIEKEVLYWACKKISAKSDEAFTSNGHLFSSAMRLELYRLDSSLSISFSSLYKLSRIRRFCFIQVRIFVQ